MSASYTIVVSLVVLAIVMYLVYENVESHRSPHLEIEPNVARAQRFGLIIDVRTLKEREELGYYPNSIPISLDRIEKEIPVPPTTSILVYSNGDYRSKRAAERLFDMGYHHVRYLSSTYLSLLPGSA